jgi:hypothetical protein
MCEEFRANRYFERVYASRLRIKRRILRMERQVALTLNSFQKEQHAKQLLALASELEWLFTWKLKTHKYPEYYWCDGVDDIRLIPVGKREFKLSASLWIGPESDVSLLQKIKMTGSIVITHTGKRLKRYQFNMQSMSNPLVIEKK